jgi:Asp-tRNA(Asn)/Glu-tRNA(Gln) amidotransferase A subunit family amidase
MTTNFAYRSARDLAQSIRHGEISPVDVVQSSFGRIHEINETVDAYCFLYEDEAMAKAEEAEDAVRRGAPQYRPGAVLRS